MEIKKTLEYDAPVIALGNRRLRTEKLVCGILALALSAALAVTVCLRFSGSPVPLAVGIAAAVALGAISAADIAVYPALRHYPYSLILTETLLVMRDKDRYRYIRYEDIGKLKINCSHFSEEYSGAGYERIDIIDGEIYYYTGEIKRRFATRDAERIARTMFVCLTADGALSQKGGKHNGIQAEM